MSQSSPAEASSVVATMPIATWQRLLPIIFFELYLTGTVLLYAFGPWTFPMEDTTELYLFLAGAHVALLLGYLQGAFGAPRGYSGRWSASTLVVMCTVVNALIFFPTSSLYTGSAIPNVASGLASPGDAYMNSQDIRDASLPVIGYVRIFVGPFIYGLLPLTVFYWNDLRPLLRLAAVVMIGGVIATFVAMGTNKAIADTILLTLSLIGVGILGGRFKFNWRRFAVGASVIAVAMFLFVTFFAEGQATRTGSYVDSGELTEVDATANLDDAFADKLSPQLKLAYVGLSFYLTHGYYAVYLSLRKPFVPCFGVGNSMFLFRQASRLPGLAEIEQRPYPARIESDGWDSFKLWSTIYPWIASDVSFIGTLFVVFLIGRATALAWLDSLGGSNPFAIIMLAQLFTMLFYFPANNQCLQTGEGWTAFWVTLIAWLKTRRPIAAALAT
jgi:hypothetical protein